MKIVQFNNGREIKIHDAVAEAINKNLQKDNGAKAWQTFTEVSTGECTLMINISEVSCIYSNENII